VAPPGRLSPARYPIASDRFKLTSQLTRQRQTLFHQQGGLFLPLYSLLPPSTLQIAPNDAENPLRKNGRPSRQIRSHLENMGPVWKIRVPLGILRVPSREVLVPSAKLRVPFRIIVKRGCIEGPIETEPLPPSSTSGIPLTTLGPFQDSRINVFGLRGRTR
jgi:hypothetical protein